MKLNNTPPPDVTKVQITDERLTFGLEDGRAISVPLSFYPTLQLATRREGSPQIRGARMAQKGKAGRGLNSGGFVTALGWVHDRSWSAGCGASGCWGRCRPKLRPRVCSTGRAAGSKPPPSANAAWRRRIGRRLCVCWIPWVCVAFDLLPAPRQDRREVHL